MASANNAPNHRTIQMGLDLAERVLAEMAEETATDERPNPADLPGGTEHDGMNSIKGLFTLALREPDDSPLVAQIAAFADALIRQELETAQEEARSDIPGVGDLVEVEDVATYSSAKVVEQPAGQEPPEDGYCDTWLWVRYDSTGDVVPVREWRVRHLAAVAA